MGLEIISKKKSQIWAFVQEFLPIYTVVFVLSLIYNYFSRSAKKEILIFLLILIIFLAVIEGRFSKVDLDLHSRSEVLISFLGVGGSIIFMILASQYLVPFIGILWTSFLIPFVGLGGFYLIVIVNVIFIPRIKQ